MSASTPKKRESPSKSPQPSDRGPPNIIEFIDSQAPNTKSAIQRHTAQHAAAQRRDARLKAVRDGSRPRNLKWQHRRSADPASSRASASSEPASLSPSPSNALGSELAAPESTQDLSDSSNARISRSISPSKESSEQLLIYSSFEESILRQGEFESYYNQFLDSSKSASFLQYSFSCPNQIDETYPERFKLFVRKDDASTYLLISYLLSIRSLLQGDNASGHDATLAIEYRGRGQNILVKRLRDPYQASSDANMQAVLILIAIVRDFGDPIETQIHITGLKQMIDERGGLNHLNQDPVLEQQLKEIRTSRSMHLPIECGPGCPNPFRFLPQEQDLLRL